MTEQQAVEVIVMWGASSVLDVKHLSPARTYTVGDAVDAKGRVTTDFLVSSAVLQGRDQLPLVIADGDELRLVITSQMQGCVEAHGESVTLDELRARGLLRACPEVEGAEQYLLSQESRAELRLGSADNPDGELRFVVRRVIAPSAAAMTGGKVDWKAYSWVMASLLFHAFFLGAFYFLPPQAMARNLDLLNMDRRYVDYVLTPPEQEDLEVPELVGEQSSGEDGKAHDGESGEMGKPNTPKNKNHYAIQGEAKPQDRVLARDTQMELAKSAGVIGMLKAAAAWNTPTSVYGAETAVGSDAINAMGALFGDMAGDNGGFGGLGPIGTGRGGGGDGKGTIGTGDLGTIGTDHGPGGHGSGYCGDNASGPGCGAGFRGRDARTPTTITLLPAEVRGGLSKEVIRREIRRHLAEIRHCYEQELTSRPDLEGRVAVKFMINADGVVQMANVMQSTLGNARAEGCIQSAVTRWTFPSGTGLSVVSYPFMFTRAE